MQGTPAGDAYRGACHDGSEAFRLTSLAAFGLRHNYDTTPTQHRHNNMKKNAYMKKKMYICTNL